jgi:RNA ligase (TIGR02306 family)
MTRKLATVRTIDDITPIPGADRIVTAHIGGWSVVVSRDYFTIGDKCVYFEPDSMLPLNNPLFAPLANRGRNRFNSREVPCVVLKTVKLRGQLSQGLAFSLHDLGIDADTPVGEDVSGLLEVEKYDPPEVIVQNAKMSTFPSFITKTDEERVQNLSVMVGWLVEHTDVAALFNASEKLDGTSTSYFRKVDIDGEVRYGACSRNNEVLKTDEGPYDLYWRNFHDYDIQRRLDAIAALHPHASSVVIQGESTGPGINGNRLGRKSLEFHAFNVIIDSVRFNPADEHFGLTDIVVPQLDLHLPVDGVDAKTALQNIIDMSYGRKSVVEPSRLAEGVVWRYDGEPIDGMNPAWRHFKSINNKYLLKE